MAPRRSSSRDRRLLAPGLLAASVLLVAALWRTMAVDEVRQSPATPATPETPATPAPGAQAALPAALGVARPAEAPEPRATAAELPRLRVPPGPAGQDPLAAAWKAARDVPQPAPPPGIASATTLEQAFAAMVAAQADTGVPAGTSPFGPR